MTIIPSKPTIVFVNGWWESHAGVFAEVAYALKTTHGFNVAVAPLATTGSSSPGNPLLQDDIAAVKGYIAPVVERGGEVLLVVHSAGGFIGSAAGAGLTVKERSAAGKPGGVIGFAFMTAGVFPPGTELPHLPFFDMQGNEIHCKDARNGLFNDLSDADAEFWLKRMLPQPALGWGGTVTATSHQDVPCFYLVCEGDGIVPAESQRQMAEGVQARVTTCSAGHMVMLSQPQVVVDFVKDTVGFIKSAS